MCASRCINKLGEKSCKSAKIPQNACATQDARYTKHQKTTQSETKNLYRWNQNINRIVLINLTFFGFTLWGSSFLIIYGHFLVETIKRTTVIYVERRPRNRREGYRSIIILATGFTYTCLLPLQGLGVPVSEGTSGGSTKRRIASVTANLFGITWMHTPFVHRDIFHTHRTIFIGQFLLEYLVAHSIILSHILFDWKNSRKNSSNLNIFYLLCHFYIIFGIFQSPSEDL